MRVFGHIALFVAILPLLTIAKSLNDLHALKDAPPLPTDEKEREDFLKDLEVKVVAKRHATCRNHYSNCACNFYKLKDHCTSGVYKAWMSENCAASCGVCIADPDDGVCDNTYPDQLCDLFATRGLHEMRHLQYFMACNCPRACGICNMPLDTPESTEAEDVPFPKEECLRLHNEKRMLHGAVPLVWCPKCANFAKQVVTALRDNNSPLVHSNPAYRRWMVDGKMTAHGENLMYHFPQVDCSTAVKSWYDEIHIYNPRKPIPDVEPAGHFTQMVWKDTTSVGCAKTKRYLCCIYEPAGNLMSTFLFHKNVQI